MNKSNLNIRNKTRVIFLVILLLLLITFFVFYKFTALCGVNGDSMYPTLKNGDLLFMERTSTINRNDIVVLNSSELGSYIVKRVVGLPGDYLSIRNDGLYINGEKVQEDYVSTKDWYTKSPKVSVTIPEDGIFVMGDNRVGSYDSRDIGVLPITCAFGVMYCDLSNVIGLSAFGFKVLFVLLILLCVVICAMPKHNWFNLKSKVTSMLNTEPAEQEPATEADEIVHTPVEMQQTMMNTTYDDTTPEYYKYSDNKGMTPTLLRKE